MVLGWMVATATASPGSAGAVHLGAMPLPGGTAYGGGGGLVAWTPDGAAAAPIVEAGVGLTDRVALTLQAATVVPEPPGYPVLLSGRYLLLDQPDVRIAVTGNLTVLPLRDEEPLEIHLDPGVAIDAGGEKVRFDAAIPVWGVSSVGRYVGVERFPVPILSTLGVNFALGDHQRLRFGLPELLSWHYRGERMYADIGGATVLVAGAVWTKVGVVF
jgi:hypothetical protein